VSGESHQKALMGVYRRLRRFPAAISAAATVSGAPALHEQPGDGVMADGKRCVCGMRDGPLAREEPWSLPGQELPGQHDTFRLRCVLANHGGRLRSRACPLAQP
jgi:hypothetical protein